MSRELESPGEFALVGAGPVATSLAATFAHKAGALGPIVAVSYRVASRIVNKLGAGKPARDASILESWPLILVHAPTDQMEALRNTLVSTGISWKSKSLIFVECDPVCFRDSPVGEASFAWIRRCPIPGRVAVGGDRRALAIATKFAYNLDRHPIIVPDKVKRRFDAAMLLGGAAFTPIIDSVAHILRETGMIDKQAARTAVALFQNAVQGYSRSGRQSWDWSIHPPDIEAVEAQIAELAAIEGSILRSLLLLGFDRFRRHPGVAAKLREHRVPVRRVSGNL